jgi:MarR family transcriptional regulator, temperature-dependent positive regulator of motility
MGREQHKADRANSGAVAERVAPHKRSVPTSIGFKLRRLQLAYSRNFQRMCAGIDIPTNQIGALSLITRNPDIAPSDVAALLTLDAAQVTPIIKQLEARNLIERRKSAQDSRSHHLRTTPTGMHEYERIQTVIGKFEANFVGAVLAEDEARQFYAMVDRLLAAAQAALEPRD